MGCFPADLNALLLLSGQLFCSSLLLGALVREDGGENSLSLSSSLALAALERSRSVELAILYQMEWKHVEWRFPNCACADCAGLRRGL